jgi:hypothetical protein
MTLMTRESQALIQRRKRWNGGLSQRTWLGGLDRTIPCNAPESLIFSCAAGMQTLREAGDLILRIPVCAEYQPTDAGWRSGGRRA